MNKSPFLQGLLLTRFLLAEPLHAHSIRPQAQEVSLNCPQNHCLHCMSILLLHTSSSPALSPGHLAHLGAGTDHLPPLLCCHPQLNPHLLPAPWFWEQLGWLRSRTLCHPRSLMTTQPRSRSWRAGSCPAPAARAGFKPCSGRGSAAGKGSQPKPFPPGIPSSILGFIRWTDRHRDCRLLPLAISPCRGPEPRQHFHIPFLQPSTRQPPSRSITGSCYSPPRAL